MLEGEDVMIIAKTYYVPSTSDLSETIATKSDESVRSPSAKHNLNLGQPTTLQLLPEMHAGGTSRSGSQVETPIWFGKLTRHLYDDVYLKRRDKLADAAHHGDRDVVQAYVREARGAGFNSWPNYHRLGGSRGPSGWTPLHQASFLGVPESVVSMLIDHGASRILQTPWTSQGELPYLNMTSLEMPQFLGSRHLYRALSPAILHHIPPATLDRLQQHFRALIKDDLAGQREGANLRLPELKLLTELQNPETYFPLRSPKIAMDGRELMTMSIDISPSSGSQCFRITERIGVQQIHDAVLFDMK
ncbi:uncharacterized protein PV06_06143 [Exophiala oligosperma]|uniref:Uncharacterized protein n=1 Tax=Exophiala oligosperma TaxID=215243 RepID=A0A0D2ARV9_9EURO|nr:uncharacterized protein PV06_06143 [Exophiala oligosperma]KIW42611.1 hypothetical protein PV06_06143 [Exophiala oligosperma]